jgi:iron complex transport system ATP-binding protein
MVAATSLLVARNLRTGYGHGSSTIIVADYLPELHLKPGQLICLLGPNGSGKSTLLRTLSGLQPPLGGVISIDGLERRSPSALAKKISLVLTDRVRGNNLTVDSLVSLGRYPWSGWLGRLDATDLDRVAWAIDATGIGSLRYRKVHTLSDGQCQKVMLARALAQDTPILMLDEPTAHLDLPSRIRLMRLLHELARDTGKAILLSTHELDLALQIADMVWLLQSGGQLRSGAPEDLILNGTFETAFAEEDVAFDKEAGNFLIYSRRERAVWLTGEGLAFLWTRRALRRAGFEPADGAAASGPRVHVEAREGRLAWRLEHSGETSEYESIEKLLQALA